MSHFPEQSQLWDHRTSNSYSSKWMSCEVSRCSGSREPSQLKNKTKRWVCTFLGISCSAHRRAAVNPSVGRPPEVSVANSSLFSSSTGFTYKWTVDSSRNRFLFIIWQLLHYRICLLGFQFLVITCWFHRLKRCHVKEDHSRNEGVTQQKFLCPIVIRI